MGLLAKERMLSLLMAAELLTAAGSSVWGGYGMSTIDYFDEKPSAGQTVNAARSDPKMWLEDPSRPVPGPVLELLNDPGPATGRAYLDWQRERVERVRRAQEALDRLESAEPQSP